MTYPNQPTQGAAEPAAPSKEEIARRALLRTLSAILYLLTRELLGTGMNYNLALLAKEALYGLEQLEGLEPEGLEPEGWTDEE